MTQNAAIFEFTTPVGRHISGCAFEAQTKNQQGAPLVDKQGMPTKKWFMGIAFDKNNPEFAQWYQQYQARAMADWPHLFDPATGQCRAANFSWKIVDGDGFDQAGKPWSTREGYAGHWVVRFSSNFAPSVYHKDRYDPMMKVTDPAQLPRGYYVRLMGNAKGNGNPEKPGMFCNLNVVEIFAPGQVIVGGPDVAAGFGGTPAPTFIPQGVLSSPAMAQVGTGGVLPGAGLPATQPSMGAGAPAPTPTMSTTPLMGVAPAPGVAPAGVPQALPGALTGITTQAAPVQPAPVPSADPTFVAAATGQPVAGGVVMGPNAQGFTIDQWRSQGYNDDQLRAAGIIL